MLSCQRGPRAAPSVLQPQWPACKASKTTPSVSQPRRRHFQRSLIVVVALWLLPLPSAIADPFAAEPRSVAVQLRWAVVAAAEGCRGHCAPPPFAARRLARQTALEKLQNNLEAGGRPCRLNGTALRHVELEVLTAAPGACDVARLCEVLEHTGQVEFCEAEQVMETQTYTPNDPKFAKQYALTQMKLPEAWELTRGMRNGVAVAVIDTGIDLLHPDLKANLWTNPDEIANNNVDDDNNGYVDDIHGWDWVENDGFPQDIHNHGTPAAGIIAATTNNGVGIAGISHGARLMPLKFGNTNTKAALAMDYALDKGVRVSCNSWGGHDSQAMRRMLDAALAAGHVFVTGSGNGGMDMDDPSKHLVFPCGSTHANIICVGSTNETNGFAHFNNYGNKSVDVGAPGSAITTTVQGGGYAEKWGNSIAGPQVAGLVALLFDIEPAADYVRVIAAIKDSVDPLPPLQGKVATGGRINALKAVQRFQESASKYPGDKDDDGGGSNVGLIVGIVVGVIVLVFIAIGVAVFLWRRGRDAGATQHLPASVYGAKC